jgi:hypothetical protein
MATAQEKQKKDPKGKDAKVDDKNAVGKPAATATTETAVVEVGEVTQVELKPLDIRDEEGCKEHLLQRVCESIDATFQTDPRIEIVISMDTNLVIEIPGFSYLEIEDVISVLEDFIYADFNRTVILMEDNDYERCANVKNLVDEAYQLILNTPESEAVYEVIPIYENGVQVGEERVEIGSTVDDHMFGGSGMTQVKAGYSGPGEKYFRLEGVPYYALIAKLRVSTSSSETQYKKRLRWSLTLMDAVADLVELVSGNRHFDSPISEEEIHQCCKEIMYSVFLITDAFSTIYNDGVFRGLGPRYDLSFESPVIVEFLDHFEVHVQMLTVYANEVLQLGNKEANTSFTALYSNYHAPLQSIVAITNYIATHSDTTLEQILYGTEEVVPAS